MEANNIILHVDHMTKNFGELKVLNDVSFDVRRGESGRFNAGNFFETV